MNVGDIARVLQGEVTLLTVPFRRRLQLGETLTGPVDAKMATWPTSPNQDTNAPNLILGEPVISGTNVQALCGGFGTAGFQPGVIYSLWATVSTSLGQTLENFGQVYCEFYVPPTQSSSGAPPNSVTPIGVNTTASLSTIYLLNAGGLTFTLPSGWGLNGGPIIVADNSGAGGTITGPVKNWPGGVTTMTLPPYGSMTFYWSYQLSGWISV